MSKHTIPICFKIGNYCDCPLCKQSQLKRDELGKICVWLVFGLVSLIAVIAPVIYVMIINYNRLKGGE